MAYIMPGSRESQASTDTVAFVQYFTEQQERALEQHHESSRRAASLPEGFEQ